MLKLANRVFAVMPEAVPVYPYGVSLYIEDERSLVIDLGAGGNAFAAIPKEKVELCLLSHFHFDHIHGELLFPKANLYAAKEEERLFSDPEEYLRVFGYYLWDKLMPGIKRKPFHERAAHLPADVLGKPGFRMIKLAGTITDRQVFDLGKRRVLPIHLPGHTPGHYGFYLEDEGILFSGDIDFYRHGPWYFALHSDLTQLISSIRLIQDINPGVLVVSHHQAVTEGIKEGLNRNVQLILDREARLLKLLKRPKTLNDLAKEKIIFQKSKNMFQLFWEKMGVLNHLKRLIKLGMVVETDGFYYVSA